MVFLATHCWMRREGFGVKFLAGVADSVLAGSAVVQHPNDPCLANCANGPLGLRDSALNNKLLQWVLFGTLDLRYNKSGPQSLAALNTDIELAYAAVPTRKAQWVCAEGAHQCLLRIGGSIVTRYVIADTQLMVLLTLQSGGRAVAFPSTLLADHIDAGIAAPPRGREL